MKLSSVLLAVLMSLSLQAQKNGDLILPKGKLIIIGGGDIPDTLFNLFSASIGGKDQPIVVIPTATTDEDYIREGGHLQKFSTRGFTNLHTIHTFIDKPVAPQSPTTNPSHFISGKIKCAPRLPPSLYLSHRKERPVFLVFALDGRLEWEDMTQA